jgi:predicted SAM-dependent methyltransferase
MRKLLHQFPFLRNFLLGIRHRIWKAKTIRSVKTYLSENNGPKLQLGAGQNILPGWFNTDYFPRENIFFLDVTKTFPIPESSFNFIFTEHHIEHISYKNAVFMLKECYKILKPGGVIKITTPDLKTSLNNYLHNDFEGKGIVNTTKDYIYSGFYKAVNYIPVDDYFKAHEINDMFMNYEHQFIYDFESMKRILANAGFINIKDCGPQDSVHQEFHHIESHDSDFDKYFSLSVEAEKG